MKSKDIFMYFLLSLTTLGIFGCILISNDNPAGSYNFSQPTTKTILPDTLREISGLTVIDNNSIGCVQDENGILFIYDINKEEITGQIPFGPNGDYEGLACVEKDMYLLRSDGMLYFMKNFAGKHPRIDSFQTNIPAANNEGLCYDKANNRLLIASKVASSRESKTQRMIHGFDLRKQQLIPEPIFTFDVRDIKQFARSHNIKLPQKTKKKDQEPEPFVRFKPSAISIHPITKKLYMLSAADHMLFVFGNNGNLEQIEVLDKDLFNKSEGICFLDDATLLISNEAQEEKSNILRFQTVKKQ